MFTWPACEWDILWLDPVAALVIAGFIGYACWEIFKLMVRFPQIKDAIIHIEPPPRQACGLVS